MSFDVPAAAYDRFMGRYSSVLAPLFADFSGVEPGESVLDVGCGPGSLTGVLVERVGSGSVTAVDPSEAFLTAIRGRFTDVDVHLGSAESLPIAPGGFDPAQDAEMLRAYFDREPSAAETGRMTVYKAMCDLLWTLWGLIQHASGATSTNKAREGATALHREIVGRSELVLPVDVRRSNLSLAYRGLSTSEIELPADEEPFVLLNQPSLFDPSRAPAGKHTAWGYCHVPHGSVRDMTETRFSWTAWRASARPGRSPRIRR